MNPYEGVRFEGGSINIPFSDDEPKRRFKNLLRTLDSPAYPFLYVVRKVRISLLKIDEFNGSDLPLIFESVVEAFSGMPAYSIRLSGMDVFGDDKTEKPAVLYKPIEASSQLAFSARRVRETTAARGIRGYTRSNGRESRALHASAATISPHPERQKQFEEARTGLEELFNQNNFDLAVRMVNISGKVKADQNGISRNLMGFYLGSGQRESMLSAAAAD